MASFAKVEDGVVVNVISVHDDHEQDGQEYLNSIGLEGTWIQTSYNSNFRKKYAAIGDRYDEVADGFKSPQPSHGTSRPGPGFYQNKDKLML
jgi:hypothetical protein